MYFVALPNLRVRTFQKLVPKFLYDTWKRFVRLVLNFAPKLGLLAFILYAKFWGNFKFLLLKIVGGFPSSMSSVLASFAYCLDSSACTNLSWLHPLEAEMWSSEKVHLSASEQVHASPTFFWLWTKVHLIFLPNARGIAVDQIVFRLSISWSHPEIIKWWWWWWWWYSRSKSKGYRVNRKKNL